MRRLIRNKSTRQFLSLTGGWGDDPLKARHFPTLQQAKRIIWDANLTDVELYYSFADVEGSAQWDFTVEVH